ncbi:NnrU family protein [Pseudomaricurvus sp.]|uniref:NnrU family protein n=1 Tax=Pseudomaricurvus sp. TaxID=2004510 RepID=UPI003F6D8AFD
MTELIVGLILFLGIHSASIVAPVARDKAAVRLGEYGWKGLYSVIALVGLILVIRGYGDARLDPIVLYSSPEWTRHLVMLLMLPVFVFFLAAYLPGRISHTLKHPMLVAVKLWAASHLLANGALADVLLFGSFLAWAVVDRISIKRRSVRDNPRFPSGKANDPAAIVGGLALYLAFVFWLHPVLIGVAIIR